MEYKCCALLTTALILVMLVNCNALQCARGPQCCAEGAIAANAIAGPTGGSVYARECASCRVLRVPNCCVEGAITDYFQINQFEKMFSNRDSLEVESHANKAFWDYQSFITASAYFQPYGFGTTYINRKFTGTKEVAAFLAHVATETSCEYNVTTKEPSASSLCHYKKTNSNSYYCDEQYKNTYPCTSGIAYYSRGALPIYWSSMSHTCVKAITKPPIVQDA